LGRNRASLRFERRFQKEGFQWVCGVDEAGRGPLAGPVVASAVILSPKVQHLKEIRDSKQLLPKKRELLCDRLLNETPVGVGLVNEGVIDRTNILKATIRAMEEAVRKLTCKPDCLLVDGPISLGLKIHQVSILKGDQISRSIAAASIVAKVIRDRLMRRYDLIYPGYGFSRHKGYPTKRHRQALKRLGPSRIHRLSFRPVQNYRDLVCS
jgi:ribonuclease HII